MFNHIVITAGENASYIKKKKNDVKKIMVAFSEKA